MPEHAIFFVADLKRTNIALREAPPICGNCMISQHLPTITILPLYWGWEWFVGKVVAELVYWGPVLGGGCREVLDALVPITGSG